MQISYVGYKTQTITAQPNMIIELAEDSEALEEVILIGYGVQKKSVVTAAIARVSEADLERTSPTRVDNALKGLAAAIILSEMFDHTLIVALNAGISSEELTGQE